MIINHCAHEGCSHTASISLIWVTTHLGISGSVELLVNNKIVGKHSISCRTKNFPFIPDFFENSYLMDDVERGTCLLVLIHNVLCGLIKSNGWLIGLLNGHLHTLCTTGCPTAIWSIDIPIYNIITGWPRGLDQMSWDTSSGNNIQWTLCDPAEDFIHRAIHLYLAQWDNGR